MVLKLDDATAEEFLGPGKIKNSGPEMKKRSLHSASNKTQF